MLEYEDTDDENDSDNIASAEASSSTTTHKVIRIPDDVLLSCGHHLHWDCMMEADNYELDKCPICAQVIGSHDKVLVDYCNEGGLQQGLDILPILREEAYFRAYPEERKCRAFLELCREGDHIAVAELLRGTDSVSDNDEDDEMVDDDDNDNASTASARAGGKTTNEILRYQDPMAGMQSALHAAVANGSREVAWLLILLASNFPETDIPALVYQEAARLGVMREDQAGMVDIRSLKDAQGRTAEDIAGESGVIWNGWIGNGRLALN